MPVASIEMVGVHATVSFALLEETGADAMLKLANALVCSRGTTGTHG